MANPTVTASLNKATYAPGEKLTLTVNYGDADNKSETVTVTGTDQAGNRAEATVTWVTSDTVTLEAADGTSRVWTKVSDNGSVAVFTATN